MAESGLANLLNTDPLVKGVDFGSFGSADKKTYTPMTYSKGGGKGTSKKNDKLSFWQKTDKTLEKLMKPREEKGGLENKTNLDKPSSFKKIAWDIVKYTPVIGAQMMIFPVSAIQATMIPAVGLTLGSIADHRKKKQKTTWNRLKPEFYTGNNGGFADYYAFMLPEIAMKATPGLWPVPAMAFSLADLPMQLVRTAMFEVLVLPYNALYKTFTYFRDKVGLGRTIGGLMTGRILKDLKDCYTDKLKPEMTKDTISVWKYLSPLHHIQINHLTSPEIRMGMSVLVNTPIYRYLMRDKTGESMEKKPGSNSYTPKNQPGFKKDDKSGFYLPNNMKKNYDSKSTYTPMSKAA